MVTPLMLILVVQELGREGILPYSSFFASNKPFDAPLAGLFTQYLISVLLMVFAPPGDAYIFMVNCEHSIINSFVVALIFA
jgi:amino acid transporter